MTRSDEGIKIYTSDYLPRIGQAIVLVFSKVGTRFAKGEYYLLLPSHDCHLTRERVKVATQVLNEAKRALEGDGLDLHHQIRKMARDRLELLCWETLEEHGDSLSLVTGVNLQAGQGSELAGLALRGKCRDQLEQIRDETRFSDLRDHLHMVLSAGVLQVERRKTE